MHYGLLSCLRCKKKMSPSPPLAVSPQFQAPSLGKLRHAMFSVGMNASSPAAPTDPTLSTVNWVPPVSGVVRSTNHPSQTNSKRDFSIMKCASKLWLAKIRRWRGVMCLPSSKNFSVAGILLKNDITKEDLEIWNYFKPRGAHCVLPWQFSYLPPHFPSPLPSFVCTIFICRPLLVSEWTSVLAAMSSQLPGNLPPPGITL